MAAAENKKCNTCKIEKVKHAFSDAEYGKESSQCKKCRMKLSMLTETFERRQKDHMYVSKDIVYPNTSSGKFEIIIPMTVVKSKEGPTLYNCAWLSDANSQTFVPDILEIRIDLNQDLLHTPHGKQNDSEDSDQDEQGKQNEVNEKQNEKQNQNQELVNPMNIDVEAFKTYAATVNMLLENAPDGTEKATVYEFLKQQQALKTNFTKMIYSEKLIQPFRGKFPRNEGEFWKYVNAMRRYQAEHNEHNIPEIRLVQKIVQTLPVTIRDEWTKYKIEVTRINDANAENKPLTAEELNTIERFETFMVRKLRITPSHQYFVQQLGRVRMGYNENPADTHRRIVAYKHQMHTVKTAYNKSKPQRLQIPALTDNEELSLYERVFIYDNEKETLKNDGVLNRKVKKNLSRWWDRNKGAITLSLFIEQIKRAALEILPTNTIKNNVPGEHWHTFNNKLTLFELKDVSKFTGQKRKREKKDKIQSNPKRQKLDKSKIKCKFGNKCKFRKSGKCKYYHEANKHINPKPDPKPKPTPTRRHDATTGPKVSSTYKPPCKFKQLCKLYKKGKCKFYHPQCNKCGKYGHTMKNCRSGKTRDPTVSKYDPYKQPNPHNVESHKSDALKPIRMGDCLYQPVRRVELVKLSPNGDKVEPSQANTLALEEDNVSKLRNMDKQANNIINQLKILNMQRSFHPLEGETHSFQTPRSTD